ncbi:MAG: hypothetical protein HQK55_17125, partial [Deltaproteobacteria bacterium]|nr:hypothetical protein [Deltaproteobacteria bacterium]
SMLKKLTAAKIIVTRIGLQETPELKANVLAGPYHPALGDLVRSRLFARAMEAALSARPIDPGGPGTEAVFHVAPRDLSTAIGHKQANLRFLKERLAPITFSIRSDPALGRGRLHWQGETSTVYEPTT